MTLVNLGCGSHFHEDWVNLDYKANKPGVISHNLHESLPFKNDSVDAIYCSHVLEHFEKNFAPVFLADCLRVLKKHAVIRLVVPDLEQLVKNYLEFLTRAKKGEQEAKEKYEWTVIELLDQMVRNKSGGNMLQYWKQKPMPQESFVIQRVGSEVLNILKQLRQSGAKSSDGFYLPEQDPLKLGKFRLSGEVHQWMYDELSLASLLDQVGFVDVKVVNAFDSDIKNFKVYSLDINPDNTVRKPDSLFMEARKN